MSEAGNTQIVQDAYAAFQRGDVNAILAVMDENVEWQGAVGTEGVLPQGGVRRGRAGVAEFFALVNEHTAFEQFEPREFVAQGDVVVATGHYRATMKRSGGKVDSDWVMLFTIRDGRVVRFREFTDSAQVISAYRGQAAAV